MVQHSDFDVSFAALSDPTRRGILQRLADPARGPASVSELAELFEMTLTGLKKHLALLEAAGLVVTEKVGRVRFCRLGANTLEGETAFITWYRATVESRMDHLEMFLNRTENEQ